MYGSETCGHFRSVRCVCKSNNGAVRLDEGGAAVTGKTAEKRKKVSAKRLIKVFCLLFVCAYVVFVFVKQQVSLSKCNAVSEEYKTKIAEAGLEKQKLEEELEKAGTDEYLERMAREKLGMVKANERVFVDATRSE